MANASKGSASSRKSASKTKTGKSKSTAKKSTAGTRTSGVSVKKKSSAKKKEHINEGVRAEVILLAVLAISILLMLSNFGMGGFIGSAVSDFFFGIFGIAEWLFPVFLFSATAFYIANRRNGLILRKLCSLICCFLLFCAFLQLLTAGYSKDTTFLDYYFDSAYDHLGGGFLGGALVKIFGMAFGRVGAYVIVVIGLIISTVIMTQKPLFTPLTQSGARAYNKAMEHHRTAKQARVERKKQEISGTTDLLNEKNAGETRRTKRQARQMAKQIVPLRENSMTHQMEMPELSIQRGEAEQQEESKADSEPADDNEKRGRTDATGEIHPADGADNARKRIKNPKSSRDEITAGVENIREEIEKSPEKKKKKYQAPPLSLLKKGSRSVMGDSDAHLRETARKLEETFESFGVKVTVNNVSCGPTVTRYELLPEQGVKVSKIVSLTDDIKLSLAAADVRMEAPIPGKSAIGIEVPNETNTPVMLRDLLESASFRNFPSNLAFAVGKDIAGQPVIADIAKMPHLLIAGATGSGKSVCINTLIMSILYKAKPEDVRLIMIDPKVVELSVYNGIPHLFIPVVTDPKKASGALNWAVAEMTDRYNKFAEFHVRDIKGYNEKIMEMPVEENGGKPEKMPQIVIIVDELADLMMVAPGEVEDAICRLAQLARAAGIHLIIATQRPSVNVITGLIKANMPSRIAFSVSSSVDSRTILDMGGAEKLLGKGDMLYKPQDYQKPARLQGSFVSDKEVSDVVAYLKNHYGDVTYDADVEKKIHSSFSENSQTGVSQDERDAYFAEAGKFIIEKEKASIGMLQRVFKIGFNRAARIMDQLCEAGVVGEEEGTKPRKVLMTMEEFEKYMEEEQ
ncbi:MAG: DNA translocase FtsK 4TM domain-containing protein [Fusicatenibacter sp.]